MTFRDRIGFRGFRVAALRLSEKGHRVGVLEKRRLRANENPLSGRGFEAMSQR